MIIEGTDAGEALRTYNYEDDQVFAKGGDDTIYTSSGHDIVDGGDGFDLLWSVGDSYTEITLTGNTITDNWGLDTQFYNIEYLFILNWLAETVTLDASGAAFAPDDVPDYLYFALVGGSTRITGSDYDDIVNVIGSDNIVDGGDGIDHLYASVTNSAEPVYIITEGEKTRIVQAADRPQDGIFVEGVNVEFAGLAASSSYDLSVYVDATASGLPVEFYDGVGSDTYIGSPQDDIFGSNLNSSEEIGVDWYTGGGGADTFAFYDLDRADQTFITDFSSDDRIAVNNAYEGQPYVTRFIGDAAFTGRVGEYRYEKVGNRTLVQFDFDGDAIVDATVTITNGAFNLHEVPGETGEHILMIDPNIYGTPGNDTLSGSGLDETLYGREGDDVLYGRAGNDTLYGGPGNDSLFGGSGADLLVGRDGNDTIVGGSGYDIGDGGAGDDLLRVEEAYGGAGNDTIRGAMIAYGGADDDDIMGDATIHSELFGGSGNDTLVGGDANDLLDGGFGDDVLRGGGGKDTMTGGTGADVFRFNSLDDFRGATKDKADIITDFSHAEGDRINLKSIDAIAGGADDAFTFIGDAAFTHTAGELHYEQGGSNTFISGDVNGDGVADFMIRLDGLVSVSASDFVL